MSRGIQVADISGNNSPLEIAPGTTDSVARDAWAVTPDDDALFSQPARGLWIGVGGDVNIVLLDNTVVLFKGAATGGIIPIACKGVYSTSTTATDVVALS